MAEDKDSTLIATMLEAVKQSLEDDKAEQVVVIDLEGKTSIADHMVIASGRSTRQVGAMAQHLAEKLKELGAKAVSIEGMPRADWVLIDARDIVIHLFRPDVRGFYRLEKMWGGEVPSDQKPESDYSPLDEQ